MEVKVLKQFNDKTTGKLRKVGDTFDCTQERFEEIKKAGAYLSIIKLDTPKKATAKKAEDKVEK